MYIQTRTHIRIHNHHETVMFDHVSPDVHKWWHYRLFDDLGDTAH